MYIHLKRTSQSVDYVDSKTVLFVTCQWYLTPVLMLLLVFWRSQECCAMLRTNH